ncbi:hypothetical protein L0244_29365 [bacterium]|nr:hypothetical protein [bacterium]
MKNTINIFSETGCISHEVLWKYRQGKLTAAEKHAVEVHLTDCELCSDALAGMMNMETDEMIAGLRKSVRNISAPKKVIRFYDYRVLSAAAAFAAFAFVFTYIINSSDKQDKKEIAQLIKQEPKKNEQQVVANLSESPQETTSAVTTQESSFKKEKRNVSDEISSSPVVTLENPAFIPDADKQEETVAAKDITGEDVSVSEAEGYAAPAQTAAGANRTEEDSYFTRSVKSQSKKKSADAESSKTTYYNDLKVAHTPAMSGSEKLDTATTGIPAMYQNADQKAAEIPAREMPFVYSKTLRDGMNYFHNKQYHDASQTFSIILERFPNDVNSQFYKGLSEMEVQNYSQSSVLLNKAMLNSDKTFYEEAKFKLALCYIALNQKKDAEKLLNEIKKEKGFYSERASEELQKLK